MATTQAQQRSRLFGRHVTTVLQRYADALEHCGADRAMIHAGKPRPRVRDDQPYPFRADPWFLQWVPLPDAAGSVVEITPGERPHLILARDEDFWHAPVQMPPQYALAHLDVTVMSHTEADKRLAAAGEHTVVVGRETGIGHAGTSARFIAYLDYDRAVKTEYEIDCIGRANLKAADGHRAVAAAVRDGVSEFELHMAYCRAAGQGDLDLPYPSIVGLNEHASILHYQRRASSPPPRTDSLLIDAGAQENGYAADVTRTYAPHDEAFGALIAAMDRLQRDVCALARAGTDFVTLNERCHELLAELLVEFGFVGCSAHSAWEQGVTTAFLPHGLGHLLGLQVHDVGGRSLDRQAAQRDPPQRHPFLRLTRTLEADMVLTIEPGIYFIAQLLDTLEREKPGILRRREIDRFVKFGGIRIEDNLRVKSRGHENLTRSALEE